MAWKHCAVLSVRAKEKQGTSPRLMVVMRPKDEDKSFFISVFANTSKDLKTGKLTGEFGSPVPQMVAMVTAPDAYAAFAKNVKEGEEEAAKEQLEKFKLRLSEAAVHWAHAGEASPPDSKALRAMAEKYEELLLGRVFLVDVVASARNAEYDDVAKHLCPVTFSKFDKPELDLDVRPFGDISMAELIQSSRLSGGMNFSEALSGAQNALSEIPDDELPETLPAPAKVRASSTPAKPAAPGRAPATVKPATTSSTAKAPAAGVKTAAAPTTAGTPKPAAAAAGTAAPTAGTPKPTNPAPAKAAATTAPKAASTAPKAAPATATKEEDDIPTVEGEDENAEGAPA